MKLYVANLTLQNHEFVAVIPEVGTQFHVTIPAGAQVLVWDGAPEVCRSFIDQHARYGLVSARQALRARSFVGLCYAEGSPVPLETMLRTVEANAERLNETSAEVRKASAVAAGVKFRGDNYAAGLPQVRGFQVEIVEDPETENGRLKRDSESKARPRLHENFEVDLRN